MRAALTFGVIALLAVGCEQATEPGDAGGIDAWSPDDASPMDAARGDAPLDALGLDGAIELDALGADALADDALGADAFGGDALGLDALGADAFGLDALGADAFGLDALGMDALSRDANDDIGSRLDRCTAGCDYLVSCGLSGCASIGIECATVGEQQTCVLDCLRGYACADVSGVGFSSCSTACRPPVDAAYPDVFATDTRADSGSVSDRCTAGCDYLLGCGFETCTMLGVDCSAAMENHACIADCLRGFACADVPGVGFAYCQSECADTVDAGPPNDAGPSPAACTQCAMLRCGTELSDCLADGTCSDLAMCLSACSDTTCRDDCVARFPASAALRDPLAGCLCTRCAGPCTQIDPCAL